MCDYERERKAERMNGNGNYGRNALAHSPFVRN